MKCAIFSFGGVEWGDGRHGTGDHIYSSPVSANIAKQCYLY